MMLETTSVSSLEDSVNSQEEECIICYYNKPQIEYVVFDCKHKVCVQCYSFIDKCPICLKPFDNQDIVIKPIYIPRERVEIMYQENLHERNNMSCLAGIIICITICFTITFFVLYSFAKFKYPHN
jgi:hypothetical protein